MSLAKTFALAESLAPLRCLVVAHFEWPDIIPPAPKGHAIVSEIKSNRERDRADGYRLSVRGEMTHPTRDPVAPVPDVRRGRGPALPALRRPRSIVRSWGL